MTADTDPSLALAPHDIVDMFEEVDERILKISRNAVLVAQATTSAADAFVGVSFEQTLNESIIQRREEISVLQSNLKGAVIVRNAGAYAVDFIAILILAKYSLYRNVDKSPDQAVVSPIIVISTKRNRVPVPADVALFFQDLTDQPLSKGDYLCSSFDASKSKWNESGCSTPNYNTQHNRYECTCKDSNTFALVHRGPRSSTTTTRSTVRTPTTGITTAWCRNASHTQLRNGTCVVKADLIVC